MLRIPGTPSHRQKGYTLAEIMAVTGMTLGLGILATPAIWTNTKFLKARSPYSQAMRPKNAYQMTALHEIGHAVDARLGVMTKYKARPDFGGWEEYKDEGALADAAVTAAAYTPFTPSADYVTQKAELTRDEARIKRMKDEFEALPKGTPRVKIAIAVARRE